MPDPFEPAPIHEELEPPRGWHLPLLIAGLLGLAVLAGILWLGRPESEPSALPVPASLPPLDTEEQGYLDQIAFSDLELRRFENLIGQEVTYLDGTITNHGAHVVVALELTIEFHDTLDRVVLRETFRPIGGASGIAAARPLAPGRARRFRAGFEHIPPDWNRRLPRLRITGLLLD
ncbi:MAG: hypothetical protein ACE5IP_03910 [Terriglobia bacterium]